MNRGRINMTGTGRFLTAALAGIAIASASPAFAQWGGYSHGFGYWVPSQNYGNEVGDGVPTPDYQNPDAADYEPPLPKATSQKKRSSAKGRPCYKLEWGADGWSNVATPCQ
jgi:hypothetical protein